MGKPCCTTLPGEAQGCEMAEPRTDRGPTAAPLDSPSASTCSFPSPLPLPPPSPSAPSAMRAPKRRADAPPPPRGRRRLALDVLDGQLRADPGLQRALDGLVDPRLVAAAKLCKGEAHEARVEAAMALLLGDDATRARVATHLHDVREGRVELNRREFCVT